MPKKLALTGNEAIAWGVRASKVDVIAAYPITPQTVIVERLSEWVEKGEYDARYIRVESEHSAMAAIIGASAAGARAFTATASHGLFYMYEMIAFAAGARVPVVLACVNRLVGPPWNIWSDWMDALATRDLGWIQIWVSNNQEAFDSVIQAYRIAEDKNVVLPAMVILEGFVLSHTTAPVIVHDQQKIDEFLPPYEPPHYLVNPELSEPFTFGNIVWPWDTAPLRWSIQKAMINAKDVIRKVAKEYEETFGVSHGELVKTYKLDDADVAIVSMSSVAETAEVVADSLRERGIKAGVLKVRVLRPFPDDDIARFLKDKEHVVVIDRDLSLGFEGVLGIEVRGALQKHGVSVPVFSRSLGLGGDEILPEHIEKIVEKVVGR
ncbi:MAG: transketolase C-terminal domain-containing protein [Candidatus Njordarchaeota archaeon]